MNKTCYFIRYLFVIIGILLYSDIIQAQDFSAKSKKYSFSIKGINLIPPILSIAQNSILFIDENKNSILDPFEKANISFKIRNQGNGNAENFEVHINEETGLKGIIIPEQINIGVIPSNSEKIIQIPVSSDQNLMASQAICYITFSEQNGFEPLSLKVHFNTSQFKEPKLRIVDFSIEAKENEIKKGTPFELTLLLQNVGFGKAEEVSITIDSPINSYLLNGHPNTALKALEPGDTAKIKYSLIVNSLYSGNSLPIGFNLNEKFRSFGEEKIIDLPFIQELSANKLLIQAQGKVPKSNDLDINIMQLGVDVDRDIPKNNKKNANTYALVIGNEDYTSYQSNLSTESNVDFAKSDALVFAEYCKSTLGIPEPNITVRTDLISSMMKRELIRLSNKAQYGGDNIELIFYYSGHGFYDDERESYIMPVDIAGENVTEGIKLSDLYRSLTQYSCKRITVFIDACFSGGGRNQGLLVAKTVKIMPKENAVEGKIVVFTASSGTEESLFYKEMQHGLFTYFLLKKMQDSKGFFNYGELFDYLLQMVPFTASDLYYNSQHPQVIYSPEISEEWRKWEF